MRARVLVVFAAALLLAGGLTDASVAEAPARASASATLVSGSHGEFGRLAVRGDRRRSRKTATADAKGIRIADGDLEVRSSRTDGAAVAEASAVARSVDVFDGLVTTYGARRDVKAQAGRRTFSGRVEGLKIEGHMVGEVATSKRYELSDGAGSVTVNRGGSALEVSLVRTVNGFPAGSAVTVASVAAIAVDGTPPVSEPAATPTPTPSPEPQVEPTPSTTRAAARESRTRPKLKRPRAPKVPGRLTAKRFAFPVYARTASAADDFGAPRELTGSHEGNDVFGPFGAPVLAVTDGELFKVGTLPISGNRLWLRSDAGDEFFYSHLSAFSPDAVNGRRVTSGQVLGFTGNTGNAEPTPPHVHFEIHPGGGEAIDPHAILTAWQRKRDVPPGAWLTRYGSDTEQRPGALVQVRDFIAGE